MIAKTPLQSHEEICELRYDSIHEKLDKLINKVEDLEREMSMGRGAVKAVAWIGGILVIIISALKLSGAKL